MPVSPIPPARPAAPASRGAATPAAPKAATTPGGPAAPPTPAGDTLVTSTSAATGPRTPTLREQVAMAEKLSGKPSKFKDEKELQGYLASLEQAKPQGEYDRDGFLASLGLTGVHASGRTDRPVLDAVARIPGYRPKTQFHGKPIWVQQRFFDLAVGHPGFFLALTKGTNPVLEAKGKLEADWKDPFVPVQTAVPTNVPAAERYKDVIPKVEALGGRFESDFHGGLPTIHGPTHPTYGTYAIARSLGFDDAAARRFGGSSNGIDENSTPYGKTSPSPLDQIDRHFNLDRGAQDTRLVYAANHLKAAIAYAKQTAYDQAEIELGAGLHSLQDLFAHGQLSPSVHAVLGQFPDEVDWNPVGFYEATAATAAYLAAYVTAVTKPEPPAK
jgi:hypothetical protein